MAEYNEVIMQGLLPMNTKTMQDILKRSVLFVILLLISSGMDHHSGEQEQVGAH